MQAGEFAKIGAPVRAERRESAEQIPRRVFVPDVLVHLVGVEEEKDGFVPMLPQQIERPPNGIAGRFADAEVAVEALRQAERRMNQTASGHGQRPVPGLRETLRKGFETARESHRVPARVVAGDRSRRKHRGMSRKRPVCGRDALLGAQAIVKEVIEPRRRRGVVSVGAHVVGAKRVDVEEDDRTRRVPRGNRERGFREEKRTGRLSGTGVLVRELELDGLTAPRNLHRNRVPALGIRRESHDVRRHVWHRAGDADAKAAGGISREIAHVRARQSPRRPRRQRPSHSIPGRKPEAGTRFRADGDVFGLGDGEADDSLGAAAACQRNRRKHRGDGPVRAAAVRRFERSFNNFRIWHMTKLELAAIRLHLSPDIVGTQILHCGVAVGHLGD